MQGARDRYRKRCGIVGMHRDLICHYITTHYLITSPIAPHMSEHVWALLGRKGSILNASWPEMPEPDKQMLSMSKYLEDTETDPHRKREKANKATKVTIYVAKEYPEWQAFILRYLIAKVEADGSLPDNKTISKDLAPAPEVARHKKQFMKFV